MTPLTCGMMYLPGRVPSVGNARANRASRAVMSDRNASGWSLAAQAVLAIVPKWWEHRAAAAGVSVPMELAVGAPPIPLDGVPPREDLLDAGPEELANAYVVALDERVRSAEGRHYTPDRLAGVLYEQARDVLNGVPLPAASELHAVLTAAPAWNGS